MRQKNINNPTRVTIGRPTIGDRYSPVQRDRHHYFPKKWDITQYNARREKLSNEKRLSLFMITRERREIQRVMVSDCHLKPNANWKMDSFGGCSLVNSFNE